MKDEDSLNQNTRPKVAKTEVESYLRQMKELPMADKGEASSAVATKVAPKTSKPWVAKENANPAIPSQAKKESLQAKPESAELTEEDLESEEGGVNENYPKVPFSTKDIILGVINIVSVVLLIILLVKMPAKAEEVKSLRAEKIKNEMSLNLDFPDITSSQEKAERLEALFINDQGVVDFVKKIEEIKATGAVEKLAFTSQRAIKDRSGNFGIPVIIEIRGTWSEIGQDLEKIQALPYLFRPISIEASYASEEGKNIVEYKYGVFLYVNDKLGQN